MKKFKALYKGMYDDLKDAEMMIEYACEIKEHCPEDKALADELAKYAKYRLEHFGAFHKIFVDEAHKMKDVSNQMRYAFAMKFVKEYFEYLMESYDFYMD
jgi:hypothetical protein